MPGGGPGRTEGSAVGMLGFPLSDIQEQLHALLWALESELM